MVPVLLIRQQAVEARIGRKILVDPPDVLVVYEIARPVDHVVVPDARVRGLGVERGDGPADRVDAVAGDHVAGELAPRVLAALPLRIGSHAVGGERVVDVVAGLREIPASPLHRGHAALRGGGKVLAKAFIAGEEKGLVGTNRTADNAPEGVPPVETFLEAGAVVLYRVRIQRLVPVIVVDGAAETVGTRLDVHVEGAARRPAILRVIRGAALQFLYGILVGNEVPNSRIADRSAVEIERVRVHGRSVHRVPVAVVARRRIEAPRRQPDALRKRQVHPHLPAGGRHIFNPRLIHHAADRSRRRLEQARRRRHRHFLLHRPQRHGHVQTQLLRRFQDHVAVIRPLKAGRLHLNGVAARQQVENRVDTGGVALRAVGLFGIHVERGHRRIRDEGARRVHHVARNDGSKLLCRHGNHEKSEQNTQRGERTQISHPFLVHPFFAARNT